ncbi:MAG: hypothetical protein M1826_006372 [Phylliscum demangeonii]|nr:MAG: hypothetical protein M1826_006372 [Phylliscum demangeonii]
MHDIAFRPPPPPPTEMQIQERFEKYYLRKITSEYADELDALRSADDFVDPSLSVLMDALKQGVETFSMAEKRLIVEAGDGSGSGGSWVR